jgi:carboxypeptidase family protein
MSRLAGVCLWLVFLVYPVLAQTAFLRGQVADQSGAVIPGAKVVLTGPDGSLKTATADDKGSYMFGGLTPGAYAVTGSAPDLATSQPVKISLTAGAQTLNLQLQVLSTAEHVTVEENAGPTLSTDVSNNASALVLRGDDLQALADDPDDLLADLQALAGPSAGPSGGSVFIDGFSGGELPPKESIREIRINQNPFSPEYDKLGYGRIEIFTKPGTDRFHGTMNYNYGTDTWNSRNPYSAEKAPLLLNEFEGDASGPINKRTSFNLDAQRNMVDNGAIINAVTLNPETLAIQPFLSVFKVPQRFTRVSPRVDYQLNDTNTLILRYSITHSDINGTGIGAFDLVSRGYNYQYTNQTVQVTDTAVFGSSINKTRFQYFRNAQQRFCSERGPVDPGAADGFWKALKRGRRGRALLRKELQRRAGIVASVYPLHLSRRDRVVKGVLERISQRG